MFSFSENENVQDSASVASHAKTPNDNRQIQEYWFKEFPWLVYDKERNLFFCQYCTSDQLSNVFTKGRSAEQPRKDCLTKHENTNPHKEVMRKLKIKPSLCKQT